MKLRKIQLSKDQVFDRQLLNRANDTTFAEIEKQAADIINKVRERGDMAVLGYTLRFDGVDLSTLRVTKSEIEAAYEKVDTGLVQSLRSCADRIRAFHKHQVQQSWSIEAREGVVLGQQLNPIERVGIYVPGGRADYPSTVLMNVIPAQVAGVAQIAVVVPPAPDNTAAMDGVIAASTLVACDILGISEVYKCGGAQAIAALAYGTESISAVDKITGPGNAFVAAAKKLVQGTVGIDMIAGPSEILIIADQSANPRYIAIDLMAQAEHDPLAACYLVTSDSTLPDRVEKEIAQLLLQSPRAEITRQSLENYGLAVVVDTSEQAVDVSNSIAPEHLEIMTKDPQALLPMVKNAGAIFLGAWTPESVGDYSAGPNHTLPTQGTARFSSPLRVDDFQKVSSVISYTPNALLAEVSEITALADAEGLWAHGAAVSMRVNDLERKD